LPQGGHFPPGLRTKKSHGSVLTYSGVEFFSTPDKQASSLWCPPFFSPSSSNGRRDSEIWPGRLNSLVAYRNETFVSQFQRADFPPSGRLFIKMTFFRLGLILSVSLPLCCIFLFSSFTPHSFPRQRGLSLISALEPGTVLPPYLFPWP